MFSCIFCEISLKSLFIEQHRRAIVSEKTSDRRQWYLYAVFSNDFGDIMIITVVFKGIFKTQLNMQAISLQIF